VRLVIHPIGDPLGQLASRRKQQRRPVRLVDRHHHRTAGGFRPRIGHQRCGGAEEHQPGVVVLGSGDHGVSPLVQGDRGRGGTDRALGVVVPGNQQDAVQQPSQRVLAVPPHSDHACRVGQDQGRFGFAVDLEEVVEHLLGAGGSERRGRRVPGEAGRQPVRIHVMPPGTLPGREDLGANTALFTEAVPGGQERPSRRFDGHDARHPATLTQPGRTRRPTMRHRNGESGGRAGEPRPVRYKRDDRGGDRSSPTVTREGGAG
jgi:hypothetical protein